MEKILLRVTGVRAEMRRGELAAQCIPSFVLNHPDETRIAHTGI